MARLAIDEINLFSKISQSNFTYLNLIIKSYIFFNKVSLSFD